MKILFRLSLLLAIATLKINAQTTFALNPLGSFGSGTNVAGSLQPGEIMGVSPLTGFTVDVSAQNTTIAWYPGETTQDGRPTGSTNGFNMRGITYDPISGNLVMCDTHLGSAGSVGGGGVISPYCGIYILDSNTGQIIGGLTTNGITGGAYTHVPVGVSEDGVVYVANQTTASASNPLKIYRWPSANVTNDNYFTNTTYGPRLIASPPILAYSNTLGLAIGTSGERLALTMDVRGSGPNTQIIIGTANANGTGTNVFIFTTSDGTNFCAHRIGFPGAISSPMFNDGIAFGLTNTFWAKQVGQSLLYLSYDDGALAAGGNTPNGNTNQITGKVISSFPASSTTDPLLNIGPIAVDNVNHLLAGLEEIGGIANGGRGKVWLFDIPYPSNTPPAVLSSRIYLPNFVKATAPMGYIHFGNGRVYANVVNNGLTASTIDPVPLGPPTFVQDLPATTRVLNGATATFQVQAVTDVTNYQWYSNNVPIAGANTYFFTLPNVTTNMSGIVFKVTVVNAAGSATSADSTLTVLDVANFFHPITLWSNIASATPITDPTNYITSGGGGGTPNERCIAYNALSNQLLVVRGASFINTRIFVLDADTGAFLYNLKTNGISGQAQTLALCGIGVADDGAVYAANVAVDSTFKIYRWADTGSNTSPVVIFGTNSSAASADPLACKGLGTFLRFGDTLAVHGSGTDTEIVIDSQTPTKYAAILRPTDGSMLNWAPDGKLLQNVQGSYGFEAYGTVIGRSLQFGPVINGPFGPFPTFWQKRFNGNAGAPLAVMGYDTACSVIPLQVANSTQPLFTNGAVGINFSLKVAAAVNFVGAIGTDNASAQDSLNYYDLTDPSQAVLLFQIPMRGGNNGFHKANNNAVAQVVMGQNSVTGTNYIFAINGNNSIYAFALAGGAIPPPQMTVQPKNLRILEGTTASMTAAADQIVTLAWYKGTNAPVDTGVRGTTFTIANANATSGGDYFAIANNINGSATSRVAHVTVGFTNDNYTLSQVWAVGAANSGNNSFPYITKDGGANTPNERSFAYNGLFNQLIIIRCPPASTAYTNWVVDAASGNLLYTLNTAGIIHMGVSEVAGSNPIDEVGSAAADDGALYVASESPNASGGLAGDPAKMMHIYRWADTGPSAAPTLIYEGDPSGQSSSVNYRWGDVITARGGGTNTELFMNAFEGTYGATLRPTNSTLTGFTNFPVIDVAGAGSIGRSIQFGPTNTVFEKRKGAGLYFSSYTNGTESLLLTVDSTTTLGGVAVDTLHNLAIGVDFIGNATTPDAVSLFDITDPGSPMLVHQYSFPSNQVANANVICQTIVASNYVYSMDANNGLIKFVINPPVNSMILHLSSSPPNINLSWGNQFAVLQGAGTLNPPNWVDLTTPPATNSVQSATGYQFYRLIQRR